MNKPIDKLWFYCNKVLPLTYDNSLSYFELLCKVVNRVNEVVNNLNELSGYTPQQIAILSTRIDELKEYIDNYFDSLDIQLEINNKIDELLNDGIIEALLVNIANRGIHENIVFANYESSAMNSEYYIPLFEFWKDCGYKGFVLCLQIDNNCTLKANINDIIAMLDYARNLNFIVDTVKYHVSKTDLPNLAVAGSADQYRYATLLNYVTPQLGVSKVIALNERDDVYLSGSNKNFIEGLRRNLSSYEFSISLLSAQHSLDLLYIENGYIKNVLSFLSFNCYPRCGVAKERTSIENCINAYSKIFNKIRVAKELYNLPVVITETGVIPFWEALARTDYYTGDGLTWGGYRVQKLLYTSLFNHPLFNMFERVCLWFSPFRPFYVDFPEDKKLIADFLSNYT